MYDKERILKMSTEYILERINEMVEEHLNNQFEMIQADKLGLDYRCGGVMISEDAIAVEKYRDGTLQYYGGFEYVDKDYRKEIGNYVFYLRDGGRVEDHLDRYHNEEE